MKQLKKLVYVLIVLITACSFMACDQNAEGTSTYKGTSAPTPPQSDGLVYLPAIPGRPNATIGISMPSAGLQRWKQDGQNMAKILQAAGYYVYLMYAANNSNQQIDDIDYLISNGCDVLIVAPVDGSALTNALANTRAVVNDELSEDIKVLSYDRLIMDTSAVDYYATFDNLYVGQLQGNYIKNWFDLDNRTGENPIYMEFFTGDPGDNNINFFFGGAMYVLQPYLTSGAIVCRSGQSSINQCTTLEWSTENAHDRMANLITSNNYGPGADNNRLDAVLCSNDSTAQGVIGALSDAGYTAENFPVITGQDCDIYSVRAIKNGKQSMSVFKDTRILAAKACEIVDAVILETTVPGADTTTYYNRYDYSDPEYPVPVYVPSYLCNSMIVDASNYRDVLVGSGYYTNADLY